MTTPGGKSAHYPHFLEEQSETLQDGVTRGDPGSGRVGGPLSPSALVLGRPPAPRLTLCTPSYAWMTPIHPLGLNPAAVSWGSLRGWAQCPSSAEPPAMSMLEFLCPAVLLKAGLGLLPLNPRLLAQGLAHNRSL